MRKLKFLLLAAVGLALGYNLSPLLPGSGIQQPFAFNHQAHGLMDCTFCHPGARVGLRAGLPQAEICRRCHATSPLADRPDQQVWNRAERGNPIAWRQLTIIPPHVYFSHNRHVNLGGLDCQPCHGSMSLATSPPPFPLRKISMKNCRNCHRNSGVSQDCAACHR